MFDNYVINQKIKQWKVEFQGTSFQWVDYKILFLLIMTTCEITSGFYYRKFSINFY